MGVVAMFPSPRFSFGPERSDSLGKLLDSAYSLKLHVYRKGPDEDPCVHFEMCGCISQEQDGIDDVHAVAATWLRDFIRKPLQGVGDESEN